MIMSWSSQGLGSLFRKCEAVNSTSRIRCVILRKNINPDGGESTETKGSEVQWRRLRRAVCGDLDSLVSRYFQDDRFVCKRDKPITTQYASFNLCSTMLLPAGREASLRLRAASLTGNPQNCLNSLVIRDPSTLSKREAEAKPPSTDVKNPRYDGVLVHLVCDMETHCD